MKLVMLAALAALLAACVPVRGTGEQWLSDAEIEAKDDKVCQGFGAAKGTQPYVDCRLRLRSDRSAEDRTRRFAASL